MEVWAIITILVAVISVLFVVGLLIWSMSWAYHDAESRGKSGFLVALLVLLYRLANHCNSMVCLSSRKERFTVGETGEVGTLSRLI